MTLAERAEEALAAYEAQDEANRAQRRANVLVVALRYAKNVIPEGTIGATNFVDDRVEVAIEADGLRFLWTYAVGYRTDAHLYLIRPCPACDGDTLGEIHGYSGGEGFTLRGIGAVLRVPPRVIDLHRDGACPTIVAPTIAGPTFRTTGDVLLDALTAYIRERAPGE